MSNGRVLDYAELGSDPGFWVLRSFDRWFSRLRRALLSSCVAKKKVSKEEGDPVQRRALPGSLRYSVWAGVPQEYFFPMLRIAQGAAELGALPLKQSSPFIRPNLRCSAPLKGPERRHGSTDAAHNAGLPSDHWLGKYWFGGARAELESRAELGSDPGFSDPCFDFVRVQPPGFALAARATFFLRRQEESSQRRRRPWVGAPSGFLALLGSPGGLPELACGSDKASRLPPARLRCSAPRKGPERRHGTTDAAHDVGLPIDHWLGKCWFGGARGRCRATQTLAEKGRGLFEGQSPEFRSPRRRRVAQGTGAAGTALGSPFLCVLSFGEAKESAARLKRENQRSNERNSQTLCSNSGEKGMGATSP